MPWLQVDSTRGLLALWLMMPAPDRAVGIAVIALLAVILGGITMRRALTTPVASIGHRLLQARYFVVGRGAAWALIAGLMARYGGPNIGVIVGFVLAALLLDLLFTLAFPVASLVAGSLLICGMAIGMAGTPGISPVVLAAITIFGIAALRFAIFDLYRLFATRQLRTRQLQLANETIRAMLGQYDEHGADALIELGHDGQIQRPSKRLGELLGRSSADLADAAIAGIFEPGQERNALIDAMSRHRQFRDLRVPLRVRGERRWWLLSGCAVLDPEGREHGYRCFVKDITEQRANEERIRIMAMRDNLTGLVNRAIFTDRLAEALLAATPDAQCGVLFMDLDSFKLVNDTYGHAAGDTVLIEAARRIEQLLGADMLAARLGGDEFAVLAWNVTDSAHLASLGDAIVADLSRPVLRDDTILPCGVSVGIALSPEHGHSGETLLRAADIALYEAKSRGRGVSVMFHPVLLREVQEQRALESDLRVALERGQLEVWYQPLLDIATRHTVGYEALLRWNHPKRGIVEPSLFIPLAEEAGLISAIGEWALRQALAEAATWHDELTVAVNVSPAQMRGDALLGQVVGALAATGVAPKRLELEITETLLMADAEVHLRTLHRLRALGVRIALDDFGTGYSSLNYLRQFPFDKLKVDRSFVSEIVDEPESRAIVETVLGLAQKFNMKTTAEGIECEAQLAKLRSMGCIQAQGFLFDKPLPAGRIPAEHRKSAQAPRLLAAC